MDAHEREAAGAAAGMQDLYGRHYGVGDSVNFTPAGMSGEFTDSGRVIATGEAKLLVETDSELVWVNVDQIKPF